MEEEVEIQFSRMESILRDNPSIYYHPSSLFVPIKARN